MKKRKILILGGANVLVQNLKLQLQHHGFDIAEGSCTTNLIRCLQSYGPDLVIVLSFQNEGPGALELAERIRRFDKDVPIIMLPSESCEDMAIAALRLGVNDYFKSPYSFESLLRGIRNCFLSLCPATSSSGEKHRPVSATYGSHQMIGESPTIQQVKTYIKKLGPTDSNVLITGETGTGKEVTAELIHRSSPRHQKPLVCINCAAIPDSLLESELFGYERGAFTGAYSSNEGKLRLAHGGTVFFDEIGDMSSYAQAKILRAIESQKVQRLGGKGEISLSIRVIAATNQDLESCITQGKFRKDLYFRLNVARIHLPPLRHRKEDIPPLLDHYIREMNYQFDREVEGFTEEALEALLQYDFPGNVRELKNLLESVFISITSDKISVNDLPDQFHKTSPNPGQSELERLLFALSSTNWNRSEAARRLHWSRMTVYRKMAKYHLVTSEQRYETQEQRALEREEMG